MRKLVALILVVSPLACAKAGAPEKAPGQEAAADFIRYAPGKAPLGFIKIEAAQTSAGATTISLPGRVTFDEDRTQRVASPIDGRAVRIIVNLGDTVKAGQPLIQLSSPNIGQLQADAQKALLDLSLSEKSLERVHKLQADGAIAEKDVAQAESDHRKSRADLGRTTTQLKALGISPTDPAINVALRAQIPGTVVERNVLVGQELRADQATPLLTISSLDTVWVVADVYEQDLGLVHEGDKVDVVVPAYPGETFAGTVKHIGDVVDPVSRTVKIRCVIANPQHRLKSEMFAKVVVQNVGGAKSIRVPAKAILSEGDASLVVVATEGETFRLRPVDVGPESEGQVRILRGLIPGEMIVTDGAIFMKREIESR